jgi:ATP synthase protein I
MPQRKIYGFADEEEGGAAEEDKKYNQEMAVGMRLSIDFVAPIFVCLALGYWIDTYFGTKPLFILVLFFLGIVTAFYNLYRVAKKLENRTE